VRMILKVHAPEQVSIFYSAITHGCICFISILTRQDRLYSSNLLHSVLGKVILSGHL